MLCITFFEIFKRFLDELTFEDLGALGLMDLKPDTLEKCGYDLIGDRADFHAYEKEIVAPYYSGKVSLGHKLYFFVDESVGSGLDVQPKVRLTTLLKSYWSYRNVSCGSLGDVEFYFWDGEEDGAVIIEGNIIVRFGQRMRKGAYLVESVESRLDKTGGFPDVAVQTIKRDMCLYTFECVVDRRRVRKLPDAFLRLVGYLCKRNQKSAV